MQKLEQARFYTSAAIHDAWQHTDSHVAVGDCDSENAKIVTRTKRFRHIYLIHWEVILDVKRCIPP